MYSYNYDTVKVITSMDGNSYKSFYGSLLY